MTRKRVIIFLSLLIGISGVAYFLAKLASGYRPDFTTKTMRPTGLLVATSLPTQATIVVNNKTLSAKTTTTISLAPGTYEVEIKKDGFSSWKKNLLIEKGELNKDVHKRSIKSEVIDELVDIAKDLDIKLVDFIDDKTFDNLYKKYIEKMIIKSTKNII